MADLYRPLKEGYEFNGKEFISDGWKMFKSEFWSFAGVTLLYVAVLVALGSIPYLKHSIGYVQYLLFGGYTVYCRNLLTGTHKMIDFLGGFRNYIQLAFFVLTIGLFTYPLFFSLFSIIMPYNEVFNMFMDDKSMEMFELAITNNSFFEILLFLFYFTFHIWMAVSYSFVLPLIVDAKMGFWQAMELSRKVVAKRFFTFVGFTFFILIAIVVFVIITLITGVLVALPVYSCIWFVMYLDIFGLKGSGILDQFESFGKPIVDINTESQENKLND